MDGEAKAAVCPLGFGQSGARLSELDCGLCRSILHNATRIDPCGHVFCGFCLQKFALCPLCGVDIEARVPDAGLRGKVQDMMDATCATSFKRADRAQADDIKQHGAGVLLHAALKSLAGGNTEAAANFLQRCVQVAAAGLAPAGARAGQPEASQERVTGGHGSTVGSRVGDAAQLESRQCPHATARVMAHGRAPSGQAPMCPFAKQRPMADAARANGSTSAACPFAGAADMSRARQPCSNTGAAEGGAAEGDARQERLLAYIMGSALGVQGDIAQRAGDYQTAVDRYLQSVAAIQLVKEPSADILNSVTVSHSKAGDALMWMGDMRSACQQYQHCVDCRRDALPDEGSDTFAAAAIKLLISIAKLLDCVQKGGLEGTDVGALRVEARALLRKCRVANTINGDQVQSTLRTIESMLGSLQ